MKKSVNFCDFKNEKFKPLAKKSLFAMQGGIRCLKLRPSYGGGYPYIYVEPDYGTGNDGNDPR